MNAKVQSVGALSLGCLGILIVFGLLLALAWSPPFGDTVPYKTAAVLLVTAVALVAGGAISGRLASYRRAAHGVILGLFAGFVSFGYVFGPRWYLLPAVLLAGLLGGIGGHLATYHYATKG